ncbi:MAG TPA: hypothetical protein VHY08_13760, partial [Bacillota bacterium]|nr:hypothetical protein [Bacillota bacterium]
NNLRSLSEYFDITQAEREAIHDLARIRRKQLLESIATIQGFDIESTAAPPDRESFMRTIHLKPR